MYFRVFSSLYMNTSFPALAVPSLFLTFEYTKPKVENILSIPALDATPPSICQQSVIIRITTHMTFLRFSPGSGGDRLYKFFREHEWLEWITFSPEIDHCSQT